MAAKGGGSWKVAYADFVTAMMAFFLVMWICGQDQKVKKVVSEYFSDPLGSARAGSTKKPNLSGSLTEDIKQGNVPLEQNVPLGAGRRGFTDNRRLSLATKVAAHGIYRDKQLSEYWRRQAKEQLEAARWSKEVKEKRSTAQRIAIRMLAAQLEEEITREIPAATPSIHREMLNELIQQINWTEIAEDLIEQ